jgi:hypothetical protein
MNITNVLRKNIGTIVACLGFILLCIMTLGDLGELFGDDYWANVKRNLTAIGFTSVGLTIIQVAIKQGLAEQALQRGLNTERTMQKYEEHKNAIKENNDKMVYLPYFLQIYNKRHTKLQKRECLINNNYNSEEALYSSGDKKLIKIYNAIIVNVTAASIKWSTVNIVYNKKGQILTLDEHRRHRLYSAMFMSLASMIGVTFLTGGLFFSPSEEPIWQKFVKLFTYCVAIAIGSVFTVIKEYEKGAFGVPNDLDEINQIWYEFKRWEIPEWVETEVKRLNQESEEKYEQESQRTVDDRTDIQSQQKEGESIHNSCPCGVVSVSDTDGDILLSDDKEQCR